MAKSCIKAEISGRVQGVGFRYATQYEALKRELTGYAKNCYDGSVEVVACGEESQVEQLLKWLQQGPRTASVEQVCWQQVDWQEHRGFITR